jgi:hypothetical protein
MRKHWLVRGLKIAAIAVIGIAVGGEIVTQLWNWLMPELFGWHAISFWQALGLLILSRIFFGGFRGRSGFGGPWRRRWEQMTPEQREKFQQGMRGGRCGKFEAPREGTRPTSSAEATL